MIIRLLALVVGISLTACATAKQLTSKTPLYLYRADVSFSTENKSVQGMISIPRTDPTQIRIDSPVTMDFVRISSCNRDNTFEKIGNRGGWFSTSAKEFNYDYSPNEVEKEGLCPIYVQIFSEKLLTAWGMINFRINEKLKARVSCDGEEYTAEGLDSCQSMKGFEQGLRFDVPIKYVTRGPCTVERINDRTLRVRTSEAGFCALTAYDGKEFFKFVLLGYEEILVRGVPSENVTMGGFQ